MAKRPIFAPDLSGESFTKTLFLDFEWHPGFSKVQAQKSVASLHQAAAKHSISPVLEISTKSPDGLGIRLSAFNLLLNTGNGRRICVEAAYQGSKVFEKSGPFTDLYNLTGREVKGDERLRNSGKLIAFEFFGERWSLSPSTAFYDWLYVTALKQNPAAGKLLLRYCGFSDIVFNPERSFNSQARSAALYVSLCHRGLLDVALSNPKKFIDLLSGNDRVEPKKQQDRPFSLQLSNGLLPD